MTHNLKQIKILRKIFIRKNFNKNKKKHKTQKKNYKELNKIHFLRSHKHIKEEICLQNNLTNFKKIYQNSNKGNKSFYNKWKC